MNVRVAEDIVNDPGGTDVGVTPLAGCFQMRLKTIIFWMFAEFLLVYGICCLIFFVFWLNPSISGVTEQHIAADSSTYIYMADVLRNHTFDPAVYIALATFPNTLWMPVLIAYALNSTILTVVLNVGIFVVSVLVLRKSAAIDTTCLVFLLLINLTTTISLLSVNKEIIDLLAVALFCRFLASRKTIYLLPSLFLALINRYEVFVAFIAFLILRSRLNPLRRRRWLNLFLFLCALSILVPLIAAHGLEAKFADAVAEIQGAQGGSVVAFLDQLEMHYLLIVAEIPKIGENLFGEFLNPFRMARYSFSDLANSYILLSNNVATALVLFYLWMKGRLRFRTIQSDWIYLAMISAAIMSIALVIQPRYFYVVYVLLCFEAAQKLPQPVFYNPSSSREGIEYA